MKYYILLFSMVTVFSSCEKLIEIDLPKDQIAIEKVFSSDATALQALSGLYQQMGEGNNFASGGFNSVTMLAGLSSDEFKNYLDYNLELRQFEDNVLSPINPHVLTFWNTAYETIYKSNAIIEGLNASLGVTENQKTLILGEAYFIRAFTHFYLTNLFGNVPLVVTTDYRVNSVISKQSQNDVYEQIIKDLLVAKEKLEETYPSVERVRPNKSTASAMLARVYMYLKNWELAEQEANEIIEKNEMYSLVDLKEVFLANSAEAIWQIMPSNGAYNTFEGNIFLSPNGPETFILRDEMVAAFESDDLRKYEWIDSIPDSEESGIFYYPSKYSIKSGTDLIEYSTVFRLAEQYLIRAEVRAQQNKLTSSIEDIDMLRARANLPLITNSDPSISKEDLLSVIAHERQVELFTEWGHRWLDLKRTNTADQILGTLKPGWGSNDKLYPIPQQEMNNNPFMGDQNDGY